MGVAKSRLEVSAPAAATGGGSFQIHSSSDGPKAEAVTVLLVEDDAPMLCAEHIGQPPQMNA